MIIYLAIITLCVLLFMFYVTHKQRNKCCDNCGGKLRYIGDNYNPIRSVMTGYDDIYKCEKCGSEQIKHHFVYD